MDNIINSIGMEGKMATRVFKKELLLVALLSICCFACEKIPESSKQEDLVVKSEVAVEPEKTKDFQEYIMWNEIDFAPHFILDGPYKGMGFGDKVLPILIESLPEYSHGRFTANTAQSLERAKRHENICLINFIQTAEREQYFYYSKPYIFILPNGVIVREEDKFKFDDYLNDQGEISLATLIKNHDLKFGISGKSAYGKGIDAIISENRGKPHVVERLGKNLTEGLLQMLDRKRIDYMLTYPDMRSFLIKKLNIKSKLRYISIAEMPENYLLQAHVACTKNNLGADIIKKIDEMIEETDLIDKTAEYYSYWLDENDKAIFYQLFNKVVKGQIK